MKSVCILLQNHYEVDIRVRRKAEALIAAGYSVDVLALRSTYSKSKNYNFNGANVYTISLGKKRGSLGRYFFEYVIFFLWALVKVTSLMPKRNYAVIDVNNLPDFLVFAACCAKWKGAKVVFDMHEITPEFYMSKYAITPNSWWIRVLKRIEKASFDFADHVITINEPIEALIVGRGLPHRKSTVIMNSADESMLMANSSPVALPTGNGSKPTFLFMYHGTLTRIYGLDIALEAFAHAQQALPGAQFWILGDGPEKEALKTLSQKLGLASKVKFIGVVLPTEIPHWLNSCDAGVLPTRKDVFLDFSFSNKLSEYVVMGKPVLSSRLKAIRHCFSEEALAYFEPNDASALSKQMARIYLDADFRTRLVDQARLEYAPISWDVMKQRYLDMMGDLVGIEPKPKPQSQPAAAVSLTR